jgi:diguanylate cyclase (GGDEF)-like protein
MSAFTALLRHALLLALLLIAPLANAAPVLLTSARSGDYLNADLSRHVDDTDIATLPQVIARGNFEPNQGATGLGLVGHPVWLRVTLQRAPGAPERWWLELSPFAVAEARFFRPDGDGGWIETRAGDQFPFAQRAFPYRQYVYPVDLPENQPVTVYFKVLGHNTTVIPIRVWQFDHWAERAMLEYLMLGACFGAMIGLALYNLLLAARLKDSLFLLYSALMASYVLFAADLNGIATQLLWPESGHLLYGRNQALVSLYGLFAVFFSWRLLDGEDATRWYARIMVPLVGLYAVTIPAALLGASDFAGFVIQRAPSIWFPLVLGVAIYRAIKGFRPALFYLIGYGPVFYGLTLLILLGHNDAPADSFGHHFYVIAGAWEAVLFSQALAERVNLLRRERAQAMQALLDEKAARLEESRRHAAELEARVALRTSELNTEIERHRSTAEQLRVSERQLMQMAYYDALTGLPNRRLFIDRFEQLAAQARHRNASFSLALLDCDHFKHINDREGHDAGDAVLMAFAQRLRGMVRETDTVARLGGDEFALLLATPTDHAGLTMLCHRILQRLNEPIDFAGRTLQGSASIGVARYGEHGDSLDPLYRAADQALYTAKRGGGNDFHILPSRTPGATSGSESA